VAREDRCGGQASELCSSSEFLALVIPKEMGYLGFCYVDSQVL
jgi:hypothetical protein